MKYAKVTSVWKKPEVKKLGDTAVQILIAIKYFLDRKSSSIMSALAAKH
jgi:hypothetical protein